MKVAAIWARVSSLGQEEISPEGQVERVKVKLESLGYVVQYVFKITWTSTDLNPCPDFHELRRLIRTRQIQAVGMLDRDRINLGLARLNFLDDCRSNGVEPIVYQGIPFLKGPEGQLMEMALSLVKEKQVERAQSGARQGLADRARLKGLPPTKTQVYGYKWENDQYVPDSNYDNTKLIFDLALSGTKLKATCKELLLRGIPTPKGKVFWSPSSLRVIYHNPIYAGRFAALRYEKVLPKKRRKNTFGKTSYRVKPVEEWYFLEGLVDNPVVTWEEFLAIQERLKLNRQYAARNAHHNFLLRGLIQCQECYAQGVGRHYYGLGRDKVYVCSAMWAQTFDKKCPSKAISCQEIEEDIKARIRVFLENPSTWLKEANSCLGEDSIADIEQQIRDNEQQYQKTITRERYALEKLSPEAFEQEQILLKAKRTWLRQGNEKLQIKLSNLKKYRVKRDMIEQMRENLRANLDKASNEDWRFILECLGTKIMAFRDGTWDIEINIPVIQTDKIPNLIKNKTPWCTFPC